MIEKRSDLTKKLESHYRSSGWRVSQGEDGTLQAAGPHGVIWLGRAVVPEDLDSNEFEAEIIDLASRRMPDGGELCPLDLLPAEGCEPDLRELLRRTGLGDHPHVSVYSIAA